MVKASDFDSDIPPVRILPRQPFIFLMFYCFGSLAQSVEHLTFNQVVGGSNPPCLTRCCDILIWGFEPPGRDLSCLTRFFYTASSHFENPLRGFFYSIFIEERKYYAD